MHGDDNRGNRLISLDVFRGLTIAAMILVNNPGSWSHVYSPLRHAEWHGWTPTDLVFPFFLFIVGVAISFSLGRRVDRGEARAQLYRKIFTRSLLIFAIGLFLNGFPSFDLGTIRFLGVLQRIALVYFFAALVVVNLEAKRQAIVAGVLLLGYWALMALVPVPGHGFGDLTVAGNVAAYFDRFFLTGHMWTETWDPEGLLSTIPAIATALLGALVGSFLRSGREKAEIAAWMFLWGWMGILAGLIWNPLFPINKALWTSSYVLFSAGAALSCLAVCYWLIDVKGWRKWAMPAVMMGMNPLAIFTLSALFVKVIVRVRVPVEMVEMGEMVDTVSLYSWIYSRLFVPWAGAVNGSLAFALTNVALWLVLSAFLFHRKIFIKV
jgi:predicted acyltransferase